MKKTISKTSLENKPSQKIENYKKDLQWDPKVEYLLNQNAQFLTENNVNITSKVNDFETLIATTKTEAEEIARQKRSYIYLVFVHFKKEKGASFIWYGIPN